MSDQTLSTDSTDATAIPQLTVLGLFEDPIDAQQALSDFRKAEVPPEAVSIVVGEEPDANGTSVGASPAVGVALEAAGLGQAGDWLTHLVSVVVPGSGVFLLAGPIGVVLATTRTESNGVARDAGNEEEDTVPAAVQTALVRFGYGADEAGYLARRLAAGSILIGLTTPDQDHASAARKVFADRNAVHIGTNWTAADTSIEAQSLMQSPVDAANPDDIVVLDSVGLLVSLWSGTDPAAEQRQRGMIAVDSNGEEAGTVDDVLAEVTPGSDTEVEKINMRYVVLAFGGLLGLGRTYVAVPAECVALDEEPIRLAFSRETLRGAPPYQRDVPFSRREEELICSYFGCSTYWTKA